MNEQDYAGPERRSSLTEEKVLLMISNAMTTQTAAMEERIIAAINKNLDEKIKDLDERIDAVHDIFEKHVDEAFPEGPLAGHKMDHEGRIKWSQTKQRLGEDVLRYVTLGAVGFVFVLLGLGILEWFKTGINK